MHDKQWYIMKGSTNQRLTIRIPTQGSDHDVDAVPLSEKKMYII